MCLVSFEGNSFNKAFAVMKLKHFTLSPAQKIGGIGAKRFCSSKDLGNYCNYVQNKGDRMEYRSCIFTCSTDGCNGSTRLNLSASTVIGLLAVCSIAVIKNLL